jgi:hypothetical protein
VLAAFKLTLLVLSQPRTQKRAACAAGNAIRMRVSRSTDDLASLVPRNVNRTVPVSSSLCTSGCLLGQLDPGVADLIAHANAERITPLAAA